MRRSATIWPASGYRAGLRFPNLWLIGLEDCVGPLRSGGADPGDARIVFDLGVEIDEEDAGLHAQENHAHGAAYGFSVGGVGRDHGEGAGIGLGEERAELGGLVDGHGAWIGGERFETAVDGLFLFLEGCGEVAIELLGHA